jgi:hypothetical protein
MFSSSFTLYICGLFAALHCMALGGGIEGFHGRKARRVDLVIPPFVAEDLK